MYADDDLPAERVHEFVRAALATFRSHGGEPAAYSGSSSSRRSRVRFEWIEATLEARALAAAEEAEAARAAAAAAAAAAEAEEQAERGGARIAARVRETLAAWFR